MVLFYMNKTSAFEWLTKAWHNLSSANVLLSVDHYTDVIAVELHYALEKILKSYIAYNNDKIPRTHDLEDLYFRINTKLKLTEEDIDLLSIASEYHIEESYPALHRLLPNKDEIVVVSKFTERILNETCEILNLDITSIKSK